MTSELKNKDIKELTSIRFFAAIYVVLYHNSSTIQNSTNHEFIINFISFGESAVSFFFILSGFILFYAYRDNTKLIKNKPKFFFSRLARLYPVYLIGFLLDIPRVFNFFFTNTNYSNAIKKTTISAIAYLTTLQSWYPRVTTTWNSPAWSLSCEFFFYFLFPFLLYKIKKVNSNKKLFISLFILYLIPLFIFFILNNYFNINSSFIKTLQRSFPLFRLNEFIIGIILGKLYFTQNILQKNKNKNIVSSSLLVLFFLYLLVTTFLHNQQHSIINGLFLVPIFSFLIFILPIREIKSLFFLRSKMLILLGKSSYTLYIIHQPIKPYIDNFLNRFSKLNQFNHLFLYIVLLSLISIFIHTQIEVKLQKFITKKL